MWFRRFSNQRLLLNTLLILGVALLIGQSVRLNSVSAQTTLVAVPTNTPRTVLVPTNTPRTPSSQARAQPTLTLVPSRTPTATSTPHPARPTFTPQPTLVIMGTYATPVYTPVTAIPPVAPTPIPSGNDVVTVLLLGSDTITPEAAARTDVIVAVAINRTVGSVSMLHFPRDLFLYVPNDTMRKINTIVNLGNQKYGKGGGARLMKETLLYNFGLKIDFYARVGFVEFQQIIQKLGGLELSVDCAMEGNKLKSPDLPYNDPESWAPYTLNIGHHKLDPYTALWYIRARGSSSDIDRGRRQMEVLRAIWRQARAKGLIEQVTTLYPELAKIVETDMSLQDMVGMAPLALSLDPVSIQRISTAQNVHYTQWFTAGEGQFAWLPIRDAWTRTIQNFLLPPPRNRLGGENPIVEIGAALPLKGYDQVAADRLSWEGFSIKMLGQEGIVFRTNTVVIDHTGGAKPNSLEVIRKALRLSKAVIISQPDPNAAADFRVEMGRDYGRSCLLALPPQ